MKLIDILVSSGDGMPLFGLRTKYLAMDPDGRVHGYCEMPSPTALGWGVPDALYSTDGSGCLIQIDRDDVDGQWQSAIITREQYEAALAAKNDGWIEWGGGECPVPCGTAVDVKHRCGAVSENQQAWPKHHKESDVVVNPFSNAGQAFWRHENSVVDIIAYRLHQPKEAEHSEESEEDLNECIGQDAAQVWGGEGKPAIGEKCEHHSGGQWEAVTIAGIYENLVTGFTDYWMVKEDGSSYTVGNPYRFRPISSEADKKREDALDAIYGAIASAERAHNRSDEADKVYEAIAAGKIPGVKLED
jgi:hypothetical protein